MNIKIYTLSNNLNIIRARGVMSVQSAITSFLLYNNNKRFDGIGSINYYKFDGHCILFLLLQR